MVCVVAVCKSVMTLPPFVRVTASSEASSRRRRSCKAEDGLIVTSKAWCAKRENGQYQPLDAHCCHMDRAIKHPVPDRVKPSLVIF